MFSIKFQVAFTKIKEAEEKVSLSGNAKENVKDIVKTVKKNTEDDIENTEESQDGIEAVPEVLVEVSIVEAS